MESSKENDLRVRKTYKALNEALVGMLRRRNFNAVTVNDLCLEALVSRATFYSHFRDKYDLFRYFLSDVRTKIIRDLDQYEELESDVNQFMLMHKQLISNVIRDANEETLDLIREFISSIIEMAIKRKNIDEKSNQHIILMYFCTGGLINLMRGIAESIFSPEVNMINEYLYNMLRAIMVWDADQEQAEACGKTECE